MALRSHRPRHGSGRWPFLLLLTLAAGITCAPPEAPDTAPAPAVVAPEIRIGLSQGTPRVEVSGDSGVAVLDADGNPAGQAGAGVPWVIRPRGALVTATAAGAGSISSERLLTFVSPSAGGLLRLGGRPYRGKLVVARDRAGLTIINPVTLEDYLAGVVSAEMGRRDSSETEALAAQAIVSRTFALRNLGKRATEGFDLYASVADMAYGGAGLEYPLAREMVRRTAGQVLTWQGTLIDAFFFSTCAGHTAEGTEVFAAADRPYLKSVADVAPDGQPYCRISPRYRWRVEWSVSELRGVLRQSLPAALNLDAERAGTVRGVSIADRTGSDRVARVTIALRGGAVDVNGPQVRQVLHPVGETSLRSAIFQLTESRAGGELTRLVAEGAGAGHGVGFCQWGAVGRSHAGQDAPTILAAYFPGTSLSRAY